MVGHYPQTPTWEVAPPVDEPPPLAPRSEIVKWAERYHLADGWAVEIAIRLAGQLHRVAYEGSWEIKRSPRARPAADRMRIVVSWDPSELPTPHDRKRIVHGIEQWFDKVKAESLSRGIKPIYKKRASKGQHFVWAALRQVRGHSYSQIARDHGFSQPWVSAEVRKLAKSIDLNLRPNSPGGHPIG